MNIFWEVVIFLLAAILFVAFLLFLVWRWKPDSTIKEETGVGGNHAHHGGETQDRKKNKKKVTCNLNKEHRINIWCTYTMFNFIVRHSLVKASISFASSYIYDIISTCIVNIIMSDKLFNFFPAPNICSHQLWNWRQPNRVSTSTSEFLFSPTLPYTLIKD